MGYLIVDISNLKYDNILHLKKDLVLMGCEYHEVSDGFFSRLRDQQDDTMDKVKQWDLLKRVGEKKE